VAQLRSGQHGAIAARSRSNVEVSISSAEVTSADADDRTLDQQIALMARRERQRAMGRALAHAELTEPDRAVLDGGARTVDAEIG